MRATQEETSRRTVARRDGGSAEARPSRSLGSRPLPVRGIAAGMPLLDGQARAGNPTGLPLEAQDDRTLARMIGLAALGGVGAWLGLGIWLL